MTGKKQLVYVNGDDWCGLYFNGNLQTQGHSLDFREVMETITEIGGTVNFWTTLDADMDWLGDHGILPLKLSEVQFAENELIPDGLIWS